MPSTTSICSVPGCENDATYRGRCAEHQRQHERFRGTKKERGYADAWPRLRLLHLHREPLCRECMKAGIVTTGQEVDHIIPHDGTPELRLNSANLQTLCRHHHSQKTMRETLAKKAVDRDASK